MGRGKMVTIASCALAKGYASTVVDAKRARNVEGHQYASTIVNAVSARIVGLWARAQQIKNSEGLRRLKWK